MKLDGRNFARVGLALLASALLRPAWAGTAGAAPSVRLVTELSTYVRVEAGQVAGPATDFLRQVLQSAGVQDYDIGLYPWARAYDLALHEPNVLIYVIARTAQREDQFKWVGEFTRQGFDFYTLKARSDVVVRSLPDARAYTVAVARDDVRHQYVQRQGFSRVLVSGSLRESFRLLVNRRADLIILNERIATDLCQQEQFDCRQLQRLARADGLETSIQAAFSLGTPDELVERVRRAFEKLKAEGRFKP